MIQGSLQLQWIDKPVVAVILTVNVRFSCYDDSSGVREKQQHSQCRSLVEYQND